MATKGDNDDENDRCDCNKNKRSNYPVFTNPLDMERFFNQQMDEIVKSFGIFGSFFNGFPEYPSSRNPEVFESDQNNSEDQSGSRDFMLKNFSDSRQNSETPSYHEPRTEIDSFKLDVGENGDQKVDSDLDKSGINSADLDKLYRHPQEGSANQGVFPFFGHRGPGSIFGQMFGPNSQFPDNMLRPQVPNDENSGGNWTTRSYSFSQSSSRSQFQLPDGSTEEKSVTTDNQGNKINKLMKTTRDGEWYCRTCITKPGGTEECQEESSHNYQPSEYGSSMDAPDERPQELSRWNEKFAYFSDYVRGNTTNNLAEQMIKKEIEYRDSLIEKLKKLK